MLLRVRLGVVPCKQGEEGGFARALVEGVRWILWKVVKRGITVGALEVPSFALPDFPVEVFEDLTRAWRGQRRR
jgi:hypothetical protein